MLKPFWEEEIRKVRHSVRQTTVCQILEPLRKGWPMIFAELDDAWQKDYSNSRLGEVLAHEINKVAEKLQKEHEKKFDDSWQWTRKREEELQSQIVQFKKEKEALVAEVRNLRRKSTDLERQVHNQNIEIVRLDNEIASLKGIQADEDDA